MKIAFLAGTLGQGGAEKQLFLLASELKKRGEQVRVYSVTKGEFWESRLKEADVEVIHIGNTSSRFQRLIQLINHMKSYKPEVLYSFHFYTSVYAAVVGRLLGIFSIGSIRNNGTIEKKANGLLSYLHFHLPHAIIANSLHGLSNSQNIFLWKRQQVGILTNALELENKPDLVPHQNKKIKALFVGRLVDQKDPHSLLKIFSILKSKHQFNFEATLLGDGPLKEELINYRDENGLTECVTFEGNVPNVLEFMAKSDVLVCTSRFEGTPNVILEAMAMRLPVISANFVGAKILLGEKAERGFVFDNVEEAAQLVLQLEHQDLPKITQDAEEFIASNYSKHNLADRFYQIFKNVRQ